MKFWAIDYVVGNTYRRKYVLADSADQAIKKARVKTIVSLYPEDEFSIAEQLEECFKVCREIDDSFGMKVNQQYSLFILVQPDPDFDDGTVEYFIELNDTSTGTDVPCAKYNETCSLDSIIEFKRTVLGYLQVNGIGV